MEMLSAIVVSFIGGGALIGFIEFLINRKDKKDDEFSKVSLRIDGIDNTLKKAERDSVRLQMMLLMSCYPDKKDELMTIAEHYFVVLKGDWYMTSMFKDHMNNMKIDSPIWFNANK